MWTFLVTALTGLGLVTGQPVLITSAAQYEAQPTLDLLDREGIAYDYHELGLSIDAALNIKNTTDVFSGKDVIYVTSGGAFVNETGKLPYLTTADTVYFSPTSSRLMVEGDPSLVLGNCLSTMFPSFEFFNSIKDLPVKKILVSPTISHTTAIEVSGLPEKSDVLENMEMYYLKNAFSEAKNLSVIIAVTNEVGTDAFAQYTKYKGEAANMTASYVLKMLNSRPSKPSNVVGSVLGGAAVVVVAVVSYSVYRKYKRNLLQKQLKAVVYDLESATEK